MIQTIPEFELAADLIQQRLDRRGLGECVLGLEKDSSLSNGAYRVEDSTVYAGGISGILAGAGFWLRSGMKSQRFECTPQCSLRGVYFASHFHNFYHVAPMEELYEYIADLALYGINSLKCTFPLIDLESPDCPQKEEATARISAMFRYAASLGMTTCINITTSQTYKQYPREFAMTPVNDGVGQRGNTGNGICPGTEAARLYLDAVNDDIFAGFRRYGAPIDYVISWPYDEGGCGCEKCAPWGAKGFIEMSKREHQVAKRHYPNVKLIVSTWMFDMPYEGEWEALAQSLGSEKWCDVILADSHDHFPWYPLEQGAPGGLPLIAFPEISMWGLFPWGGFGATPLPRRFENLWAEHKHITDGGYCYSEGIYEDINKVVDAALYADGHADYRQTLAGYARYELGIADTDDFVELCRMLEDIHCSFEDLRIGAVESSVAYRGMPELAEQAYQLALKLDRQIPGWAKRCWRWRIILLRTRIEYYRSVVGHEKKTLQQIPEVMASFRELVEIFHCSEHELEDELHQRVRPWAD